MNTRLQDALPPELLVHMSDLLSHADAARVSRGNRFFNSLLDMKKRFANSITVMPKEVTYPERDKKLIATSDWYKGWGLSSESIYYDCSCPVQSIMLSHRDKLYCVIQLALKEGEKEFTKVLEKYNTECSPERGRCVYTILIPNLIFLDVLLKELVSLNKGLQKAATKYLRGARSFIKEVPSQFNWLRGGDFKLQAGFPRNFVEYQSGHKLALVKVVTIKKDEYRENQGINVKVGFDPKLHAVMLDVIKKLGYAEEDYYKSEKLIILGGINHSQVNLFLDELVKIDPQVAVIYQDFRKLFPYTSPDELPSERPVLRRG